MLAIRAFRRVRLLRIATVESARSGISPTMEES